MRPGKSALELHSVRQALLSSRHLATNYTNSLQEACKYSMLFQLGFIRPFSSRIIGTPIGAMHGIVFVACCGPIAIDRAEPAGISAGTVSPVHRSDIHHRSTLRRQHAILGDAIHDRGPRNPHRNDRVPLRIRDQTYRVRTGIGHSQGHVERQLLLHRKVPERPTGLLSIGGVVVRSCAPGIESLR